VFHTSVAQDAGLTLPNAPNFRIQYGGGPTLGRLVSVYVELGGRRWKTEVVFVDRLAFRYALLGRRGVFAQFNEVAFLEKVNPRRVAFRW
jgi:hypothetical protein